MALKTQMGEENKVQDLYFVGSPNVLKVCIALEEMELPHRLVPVDISRGDHLDPALIGGGVTGKLPVLVDNDPADGSEPTTLIESGAILAYLGEKTGKFMPGDGRDRWQVMQWLFWQMGGIGPIGGQLWHFRVFAPRIAPDFDNSYALNRYDHMFGQLWTVMNKRLEGREFLCGPYSVADMACFPWIAYLEPSEGVAAYPNVQRWRDTIGARPAVRRAYDKAFAVETGYEKNDKGVSIYPWEKLLQNVITT